MENTQKTPIGIQIRAILILAIPFLIIFSISGSKMSSLKIDKKTHELISYKDIKLNKFLKTEKDNQVFQIIKYDTHKGNKGFYYLDKHLKKAHWIYLVELEMVFKRRGHFEIIDTEIYSDIDAAELIDRFGYIFYKKLKYNIKEYSFNEELYKHKRMVQYGIKMFFVDLFDDIASEVKKLR